MNYINHKGKLSLQISAFSNRECLLEYLEHNIVDILLVSEDGFSEIDKLRHQIKNVFILSEIQNGKDNLEYSSIYKFQSAEKIMMEIIELYTESNGEKNGFLKKSNSGNKTIIGVFSPQGGSKKTTFSLSLSNYYGLSQSTLYINLELFCQFSWIYSQGKNGFSELLYYIKQKNSNLIMKFDSIICNYNHFDFIPPTSHYQDLLEMNPDDISFLIRCLREYSDYEVIIFDIGFFGNSILELLNRCDKIYVPVNDDILSKDKKDAFYRQLREVKEDDILNKLEELTLPYDAMWMDNLINIDNSSEGQLKVFITNLLELEV